MGNYLNGKLLTLLDMALSYENGNEGEIKPKTRVVVNTNRIWYGKNSTASAFLATAYDEQNRTVDSIRGYFLEPETKYEKAKTEGGKMAIMSGAYEIIPKEEMRKRTYERRRKSGENDLKLEDVKHRYDWYIDAPPGRSSIAIHGGKIWENTEGCFIPGDTIELDADGINYRQVL